MIHLEYKPKRFNIVIVKYNQKGLTLFTSKAQQY